jgi:hypothetical protein
MCEIIDFQVRRGGLLRRKAEKYAEISGDRAARAEWLRQNGAPLAEQVRATLHAGKAAHDCREIVQSLAGLPDDVRRDLHS